MNIFKKKEEDNPWMSISDLMSVLMMIFLFISVSYMLDVTKDKNRIKEVAITYNKLQNELYEDLDKEFEHDLKKWNAVLDKSTLALRFEEPDVLFAVGSSDLKKEFKNILDDFFPRYVKILTNDKYKDDVEEIRIEGHTSSEWMSDVSPERAYLFNMELSQNRTRMVLEYVLSFNSMADVKSWLKARLTANGLSSSKLLFNGDREDKIKSRRVEFRVRTNAEKQIMKILTID